MGKLYKYKNLDVLKHTFMKYDNNSNGVLEKSEFTALLKSFKFDDNEIDLVTKVIDLNGDGLIELSEFINACSQVEQTDLILKTQIIFDIIDKDGSNYIDKNEFDLFFKKQNINIDKKEIDIMFDKMDEDQNGIICLTEFNK